MRIRQLCTPCYKLAALAFLTVLLPMGCAAQTPKKVKVKRADKVEIVDSVAQQAINDSVFSILMNGKVKAMLVSRDGNGVKYSEAKWLTHDDRQLLRFLITEPALYQGTTPVYGQFLPCIAFEFQKSKEELITLRLDFGLREWALNNREGKELYKSSLSTNSLLRFSHFLYPDNGFIKNLYYSTKK